MISISVFRAVHIPAYSRGIAAGAHASAALEAETDCCCLLAAIATYHEASICFATLPNLCKSAKKQAQKDEVAGDSGEKAK